MTGTQEPSPFLPDPDLIGNAEGDRRALRRDRQAAQDAVDAHAAARGQAASIAAVMQLAQRYAEREGLVWDDLVGEDVAAYVALARSDLAAVAPLMTPAEFGASSSAQAHPVTAAAAEDRRILAAFDEYRCKATAGRIRWYAFRDAVLPLMGDPTAAATLAEIRAVLADPHMPAGNACSAIGAILARHDGQTDTGGRSDGA